MAQYRGVQVHGVSDQGLAALSFDTWLLLAAKPVVGCACPLPSSPPPSLYTQGPRHPATALCGHAASNAACKHPPQLWIACQPLAAAAAAAAAAVCNRGICC